MNDVPLVMIMHDGKKFHAAVEKRVKDSGHTMDELLTKAIVNPATAWRWTQTSRPTIETVRRIEKVLSKWEWFGHSKAKSPKARA